MAITCAFHPTTGSEVEWNAAYYRLEDYFRALHLVNKVHQSQIILQMLEQASARHAIDPSQNPTTLAMEETRRAMDHWCEELLQREDRIAVVGLISLLAVDAAGQWPRAFLSDDIPEEFRRQVQESDLRAGPDLRVSSMVPRPIDVSPLLDAVELGGALEKARLGLTFLVVTILVSAISASLYWLWR